ncbi:ferrous iron transporter B [Clostridium formicaceticum]|uniref:Ferrous iron transport protein B n=1 Tax=Clostridium formicaceticum TaxID=1497 RepID=A0AAC9WF29_9CLOT|nr:ferrous iron transporter B [Clostridium formicaceticum]AOY75905.1 ferrous iron transporter B [Clostridium formicaceticum]ARE86249.1 Ferrous iron transport protein B [Clostridium formicaceticum]
MGCHDTNGSLVYSATEEELKILLMGNPNVGKSVIFSKLTGMQVMTANYAGTTVDYAQGKINHQGKKGILIDVPGTYSLEAMSPAEKVAVRMLKEGGAQVVICVLDATYLERSIHFAYQVMEYEVPVVFVLNLLDIAETKSIFIDIKALEKELNAPVISTIATRNIGLKEVLNKTWEIAHQEKNIKPYKALTPEEGWEKACSIAEKVQVSSDKAAPSLLDKFSDLSLNFFPGLPIAVLVLFTCLAIVVGGGKALRALILLPVLNNWYVPFISTVVSRILPEGILLNVLIGEYGMLIKGIEWPFALILPYVVLFYGILSVLEDSGYLPHLGVIVDGLLSRIGIQGSSIVPFIMGYGCAIPAILGSRAATSHKERLIISTLVTLAVPCIAQTGAFIALLGNHSMLAIVLVYFISFGFILLGGVLLNKTLEGEVSPMLLEIPSLLMPNEQALFKKIWLRVRSFMVEAELPMILAVGLAAVIVETGMLNSIGKLVQPLVVGWLGLPPEASIALILGIIRRELAVLPLLELNLSTLQMVVGAVVALFYLPCLSVFGVLVKEFHLKVAMLISFLTIFTAIFVGGLIYQSVNLILSLL